MHAKKMLIAAGFAALMALSHAPAQAGDVNAAVLSCYVDTFALDTLRPNVCVATWTPNRANNPTIAHFEVTGLPAGNYGYSWSNLESGGPAPACGNTRSCNVRIATETNGDGEARLAAAVTDLDTGAVRTVSAVAYYYDGWH
ncbi:hypothetical protein [Lysobacter firmicutimachus]|uniref:Uncharacterized protein n=1 Tax=Lysobacter firmicutimachus TaxID=1792846 RepID=A0ABU8CZ19_9GAMM